MTKIGPKEQILRELRERMAAAAERSVKAHQIGKPKTKPHTKTGKRR